MTGAAVPENPDDREAGGLSAREFRELFPAARTWTWLDTPGCPPAAEPVAAALSQTVAQWSQGSFDWLSWDARPQDVRAQFARFVGLPADGVALVSSVAEAAATVAAAVPAGRVVVLDDEFRSNLYPWLGSGRRDLEVVRVPVRPGVSRDRSLAEAVTDGVSLVAVSEVLSSDGARVDLLRIRAAAERVGAQLFVDVSQSLGALATDLASLDADYVACHGYKWLLCPRGAAWLAVRPDRLPALGPLAPSWKSTAPPHGYFGGGLELPPTAAKLDCSPAWFSWIGASAALALMSQVDRVRCERHCLTLAAQMRDGLTTLGCPVLDGGAPSQIVAARSSRPEALAESLRQAGVVATVTGDRVRFGFHYFNDQHDVATALDAARAAEKGDLP